MTYDLSNDVARAAISALRDIAARAERGMKHKGDPYYWERVAAEKNVSVDQAKSDYLRSYVTARRDAADVIARQMKETV